MQRILAQLSYDGAGFHGYQRQVTSRTVQEEFEKGLAKLHKAEHWPSLSSGRTDTGVHGVRHPVQFDTPLSIPKERWPMALSTCIPRDMHVLDVSFVDSDFHARHDAIGKEYCYRLYTSASRDVFRRNYAMHLRDQLDWQAMQTAARYFEGTHDFSSVSSPKTYVENKVRTIYRIEITTDGCDWEFRFVGSGFLYQMVRVLVGTLLKVGRGEWRAEYIPELLAKKDRTEAGITVPGNGLYLMNVFYHEDDLNRCLRGLKNT
ncbi:tRNA pseudouridine(38-40) synthase TruA [Salisediminibacterium halotolerans]|uniref:tRNA pseudouridine(38-40) synthase TruA n=1 Tax=Salisediminibacterium halotolerans TaxID=517425 RepID=UPI000EAB925F|nr:tRNA pseudouridine(38-40) synthase TruA [Salisediminibacterium halotolerans]RLJ73108.1 tRNA pseudouridine38-40 synthase [Actinophytocola xinjiangensis]RPE86530.1 tRNA pseudouridine38-40 synthase [Salisediminibacterium halotolerans]TWG33905.1 tRNA pseudouridine38-40 synthase [Salisediminibacterium halotolerans]GEL07437.1 tRNA pseudouridine synthase A [Salisediminibacterium halotolerans]